mmetsp:Transcript_4399/g.6241  ORF Transcript_4399/g.6241 Transcript_4399/m.6241 type:complete len:215 (+) Transcript_4399:608-1252(+)
MIMIFYSSEQVVNISLSLTLSTALQMLMPVYLLVQFLVFLKIQTPNAECYQTVPCLMNVLRQRYNLALRSLLLDIFYIHQQLFSVLRLVLVLIYLLMMNILVNLFSRILMFKFLLVEKFIRSMKPISHITISHFKIILIVLPKGPAEHKLNTLLVILAPWLVMFIELYCMVEYLRILPIKKIKAASFVSSTKPHQCPSSLNKQVVLQPLVVIQS